MRNTLLGLTVVAMATAVAVAPVLAQARLTRDQIVQSLFRTEGTVAVLDPAALEAEARRRAASGGANATGPISDQLTRLPQISVEINFDRGSARIVPGSYRAVGLIADALHTPGLQGMRILLIGHTDSTGTREYNFALSQRRAAAVRDALATTFRVPGANLIAIGLGEEQLQDPANPEGAVNRRVQIINLGQ